MQKPLITAHSGCDNTEENSLEFVLYALGQPVNCLEVDVRKSKDGKLVLAHDEGDYSCELKDVFVELSRHGDKKINCDLKISDIEIEVFELAKKYKVENQLIYSGAVGFENMRNNIWITEYVEWYLNIDLILSESYMNQCSNINDFLYGDIAKSIKELLTLHKAKCLNMHYMLYRLKLVEAIIKEGIPLSLWTPSEKSDLDSLISGKGILNITTRNVKHACSI